MCRISRFPVDRLRHYWLWWRHQWHSDEPVEEQHLEPEHLSVASTQPQLTLQNQQRFSGFDWHFWHHCCSTYLESLAEVDFRCRLSWVPNVRREIKQERQQLRIVMMEGSQRRECDEEFEAKDSKHTQLHALNGILGCEIWLKFGNRKTYQSSPVMMITRQFGGNDLLIIKNTLKANRSMHLPPSQVISNFSHELCNTCNKFSLTFKVDEVKLRSQPPVGNSSHDKRLKNSSNCVLNTA